MRSRRFTTRVAGVAALLCIALPAAAVIPETGMYWDPRLPGKGYMVDYQNGKLFFTVFSYGEVTREPDFRIASGELVEGLMGSDHEPGPAGAMPRHGFRGPLLRVAGGPCFSCIPSTSYDLTLTEDATVELYSYDVGEILLTINDPPRFPYTATLFRYNFGHAAFGQEMRAEQVPDMRGDWVFVDQPDAGIAPLRLRFTTVDRAPDTTLAIPFTVTFTDPVAGAELRCGVGLQHLTEPTDPSAKRDGCDLYSGQAAVMSFAVKDMGIQRVYGSRGELTNRTGPVRHPQRVVGFRIE